MLFFILRERTHKKFLQVEERPSLLEANENEMSKSVFDGEKNRLEADAIFFGIEKFRKTRILLQEREVFVVARVIAIGGAKIDGNFQIR